MKTKRKIIISALLALFFITNVCSAKSFSDENQMKYGVVLKPHFSSIDTLSFVDSTVFAPAIEFFDEFRLSSVVGLRFSLEYAYRGSKIFVDEKSLIMHHLLSKIPGFPEFTSGDIAETELVFRTQEVQLAVTPRFYLGGDEEFSIFVGPYLSYIRAAKLKISSGDNIAIADADLFAADNKGDETISRIDYGIVMGLDYEFDSGVTLGCSYSVGHKNVLPKIMSPLSAKKSSGGITLGYNFAKLFD